MTQPRGLTHTLLALVLSVSAVLLSGCLGALQQDPEPKSYYVLEAKQPEQPLSEPALKGTLLVRDIRVAPPFNTRSLTYRSGPSEYAADYYHLYLAQPGDLVTQQVRTWLGQSGLFRNVALPGSGLNADFILEGLVTELYGDFRDDKNAKAVVAAQFFLLDERGAGREIVLSRSYRWETPLSERTPEGLMAAMNQAFSDVLLALSADLGTLDVPR
ncbi:MAG: ABC-type transport auxiliary lipoprotein family protein [Desulfocurvibacter africanus]